ncbi:MAG: DUF5615 family PIN-like protein, partial [Pseudonocardia sp.]
MRFLIDECLSPTLATILRAEGHDAVHVADLGMCGVPDTVVMQTARDQQRVVLSADTGPTQGRHRLRRTTGAKQPPAPSVVLFRSQEVDAKTLASVLLANLDQLDDL